MRFSQIFLTMGYAIINFAEKEGILRKRYLVVCSNEECQFFYDDFDADELIKVMGEK